jgi:hypothetical protein
VLFKFRPDVTEAHKEEFVAEIKKLKDLPCVKDQRLIVGGPSVTNPIERSKGYQFALLSFHEDKEALAEYQASKEHHEYDLPICQHVSSLRGYKLTVPYSVTSKYLWPFKEDVTRFDFEVAPEDEYLCHFGLPTNLA